MGGQLLRAHGRRHRPLPPPDAPDAQSVPAYAAAGVNASARFGAYAGSAVREADGRAFGAVCGLSPEASDDSLLEAAEPVLQLLGQLLTLVLAADRQRDEAARRLAAAELAAQTDVLTGLYDRRAWEQLLAVQEERVRRLGDPTVLAMIDLDMVKTVNDTQGHAAGDDDIRRAAVRERDAVARLGGDEFGGLMTGCTDAEASSA